MDGFCTMTQPSGFKTTPLGTAPSEINSNGTREHFTELMWNAVVHPGPHTRLVSQRFPLSTLLSVSCQFFVDGLHRRGVFTCRYTRVCVSVWGRYLNTWPTPHTRSCRSPSSGPRWRLSWGRLFQSVCFSGIVWGRDLWKVFRSQNRVGKWVRCSGVESGMI